MLSEPSCGSEGVSAGRSPGPREGPGADRPGSVHFPGPALPHPGELLPPCLHLHARVLPGGPALGPRPVGGSVLCDSSCCLENTFLLCYCFGFNRRERGSGRQGAEGRGGDGSQGGGSEERRLHGVSSQVKGQGRRSGVSRQGGATDVSLGRKSRDPTVAFSFS